ncbi:hypothetical protein BH20CHL7_BH20CHL7_00440 [soil metagenome]
MLAGFAGTVVIGLALAVPAVVAHENGTMGIDLAADRVPPGATVTLVGEGWAAREPLRLDLVASGRTFDLGAVLTGVDGHFVTTMMIPDDAPPGPAVVDARSERGVIERAVLTIDPDAPAPSLVATSGGSGQPVATADGIDLVPFIATGLAIAGLGGLLLRTRRATPGA